jgi:hypothetical protein
MITKAQAVTKRERRAVAEHACPHCHAQRHFSCRYASQVAVRFMKHPHPERMALVQEETR